MGFNITEIVQSDNWKNFMAKLYGLGASVVIIGALFKLMHWKFASAALIIGMTTEAFIFFFSAFEPPHEEVDWTLVYPELTGISDEDELKRYRTARNGGMDSESIQEIIAGVIAATGGVQQPIASTATLTAPVTMGGSGNSGALVFTEKFNQMLEKADIGPELFDKVGKGLAKLSQTTEKLSDISNAAAASNEFTEKMKSAAGSVGAFTQKYEQSSQVLGESINLASESYQKTAGVVAQAGDKFHEGMSQTGSNLKGQIDAAGKQLNEIITAAAQKVASDVSGSATDLVKSYGDITSQIKIDSTAVSNINQTYVQQLQGLNKHLESLNQVHEQQINQSDKYLKESGNLYTGVEKMVADLQKSIEEVQHLRQGVTTLNQNIDSLNSVYGNMLSAMNVMSNN
ncbi:type IX secretion system motor protein PorL/GldL [Williamwhitmania taraxaci]|uniref:Gliding motility-associated protein GldL n=1 Tax=Williamwhitmania taraxaci TaxID=1640674 RepID=A0A1G6SM46_9BACT|nr:gliding motility protein GldL [Williamwhitmania taraxaci]SDD18000.1 gliding motility-associated protein GldL [Williamwhitmania taraxaci]